MRTSHTQLNILVEYMERHGDLSKPSGGPRGRHFIQGKWKELTERLNCEGFGESRSEDKWRKVWSDLKNNTKKKVAKINRAVRGTGGGPALQLFLTDLESRVLQIIGLQSAVGMVVMEAGFVQNDDTSSNVIASQGQVENVDSVLIRETTDADRSIAGSSTQPNRIWVETPAPPTSPPIIDLEGEDESWKPPAAKKKKGEDIASLFVDADKKEI